MIRRVIFDLDNTLIDWKFAKKEATLFKSLHPSFTDELCLKMRGHMMVYDREHKNYDKNDILVHLRKFSGLDLDMNFVNNWLEGTKDYIPETLNHDLKETLIYLRNKYDLAVLTNFFADVATERLKNAKLLEYFTDVYGGECAMKPYRKSYLNACGPFEPSECLMIGDNLENDVIGAIDAGLSAIHYDRQNIEHPYQKIKEIKELKGIL